MTVQTPEQDTPLAFADPGPIANRYISTSYSDQTPSTAPTCWKCLGTGTRLVKTKLLNKTTPILPQQQPSNPPIPSPNPLHTTSISCPACKGSGHLPQPPPTRKQPKSSIRPFKPPIGWIPNSPKSHGSITDPKWAPRQDEILTSLSGHWMIYQLASGHRYTTDDVLTAAIAIHHIHHIPPRTYLDIGTGLGSVLNMITWKFYSTLQQAVGIEAQSIHVELARRTISFNGSTDICSIVHGDLRDIASGSSPILTDANKEAQKFDLITGTPPYFPSTKGALPTHSNRGQCSFELRGGIETYCAAAARHLSPHSQSRFVVCQTGREIVRTEVAIKSVGFRIVERWDIWGRKGRGASWPLISIFCCAWGDAAPYPITKLYVRGEDGEYTQDMIKSMDLVGKAVIVE